MKYFSPKKWNDNKPVFKKSVAAYSKINGSKSKKWKFISTLVLVFFLLFFISGTAGAGYYVWMMRNLPSPDKMIERQVSQTTKIYDRNAKDLLYEVHGAENRTILELKDMSKYVISATLSAEDREFYKHHGFDIKGIARSFIKNILTGSRVGGSSITQQFVKNAVLTAEKTYTRKIKEFIIAYQLENRFSKDEILKMYLNEIPYGSVTYGIESASQRFFGKGAKDLNIAEAAFLASLPKAPSYYSPFGPNRDALDKRCKYVIDAMFEEGYITKDEAVKAKKEDLLSKLQDKKTSITAPQFVFYVKDLLSERFGEKAVEQGGLKVITTLNMEQQKLAEKVLSDNKANINSYNATNAALVSLDPKTGEVLAMVGSLDFFDKTIDGNVNVALRSRQPGSSFKPIVYATAFSRGYTPNTIVYDVETIFPTIVEKDGYAPKNYNLKEHGPVSLKKALAGSLNIPAVKMLYLAGIDNVLDTANSLGYTTFRDRSRFGLSLVLGGGEVKLLEHVNAFAVFANEGQIATVDPILMVEDPKGKVLYERKPALKKVLDEEAARQITDILSDNSAREYIFGANNYLNVGFEAAAKTGTTNDYRDAWTIGYAPDSVVGVWVGNNNNKEMKNKADGSAVAAPIWNAFMKGIVKDTAKTFTKPKAVITGKPILDGETAPGAAVKIDKASGKLATDFTPKSFIIEKTFEETHSILHYIDKDNPQGPAPADPAKDAYYQAFEDGVKKWAEKNNYISELPPAGYDDLHVPANKPQIAINSPQNNGSVGRSFSVTVKTSAPRGVSRVEYYIDETLVAAAKDSPFYATLSLSSNISNGFHVLKAVSYDDIDNSNYHEININVGPGGATGALSDSFTWISPKENSVINSFPINVTFSAQDASAVSLWYTRKGKSNYYKIGEAQNPSGYSSLNWGDPGERGIFEIKAIIKKPGGTEEKTLEVAVE